jgi:hypothetical protein
MAKVWADSQHGGTELLMLLALADFSDDDGFCYPSVAKLAAKCRTTPRHANRLIAGLVTSGELEVRGGNGPAVQGGHLNLYRVRLEALIPQKEVTATSGLLGVTDMSGLTPKAERDDVYVPKGVTCTSVKPSLTIKEPSLVKSSRPKKQSRLPDNFQPNTTGTALAEKNGLNLEGELNAFKNHHTSKGSLFLDWQAAWRTWVGNAVKFNANSSKRTGSSRHTGFDQPNYYGDPQDGIPD